MGQTDKVGDQIFFLPSVFLHLVPLLIRLIYIAVSVRKSDEKLNFAFVHKIIYVSFNCQYK